MTARQSFSILLLLLLLAGCRAELEPTPTAVTTTPLAISALAQPITIGTLAADPDLYLGQLLQLTGQFQPQPRLVCAVDPRPAPISWGLVADGYLAYVQGFAQVNEVAAPGLMITVQGFWRYWQGEVGCGPEVAPQEVYYLELTQILAPSPITRATLTPLPDVIAGIGPAPTETIEQRGGEAPTAVFLPTPSPVIPSPVPQLPTQTPAATTPTPSVTPANNTPTPSPTPENGNELPGTPLPLPTGSSGSGDTAAKMGVLESQVLAIESLARGESHSWELTLTAGDVITLYVVSIREELTLMLFFATGVEPVATGTAVAGQVGVLRYDARTGGAYRLLIQAPNSPTNYALLRQDSADEALVIRGILTFGDTQNDQLPAAYGHFWHFQAAFEDKVSILLVPQGNADLVLVLFDADGQEIDAINDGLGGEQESLEIVPDATGLYSLLVLEATGKAASYTLLVVREG